MERQRAGIKAAKSNHVDKGRKPSIPAEEVRNVHEEGNRPAEIGECSGFPHERDRCRHMRRRCRWSGGVRNAITIVRGEVDGGAS
jgi:hypothetical protein